MSHRSAEEPLGAPYLPTVCPDCRHRLVQVKDRMECHNPDCRVIRVDSDGKSSEPYAVKNHAFSQWKTWHDSLNFTNLEWVKIKTREPE